MGTNFEFLAGHDPLLSQFATAAERAFVADPNTTLVKLRQLAEAIAQDIASRLGIDFDDRANQSDSLFQSILAKAFRGELVSQDPNDEPASELLARIQKEREEATALVKAAKKATKKKAKA